MAAFSTTRSLLIAIFAKKHLSSGIKMAPSQAKPPQHSNGLFFAFVTAFSAIAPHCCWAQSALLPAGLSPGDEYRLVFVTDGRLDATSSEIEDYNAFVTSEARASSSAVKGINADWFVIGATSTTNAISNTGTDPSPAGSTGVPVYLVDGVTRIADDYDDLWDGDIDAPINVTQTLAVISIISLEDRVWTGTAVDGISNGRGPLGAEFPSIGTPGANNPRWANNGGNNEINTESLRLFGISDVLTAVPEPSGLLLAVLATLGVSGTQRNKNAL